MSIIRLSVIDDEVFVPSADGNLAREKGVAVNGLGRFLLGKAGTREEAFRGHIDAELAAKGKALGAGPVVVMVHGFLYDPADVIQPERPQETDNPHDHNFHFSNAPARTFRHTSSWPLGLGFAEEDAGRGGLTVGFGWDSKPDVLKAGPAGDRARIDAITSLSFFELAEVIASLVHVARGFGHPDQVSEFKSDIKSLARNPSRESVARIFGRIVKAASGIEEVYIRPLLDSLAPLMPAFYQQAYERAERAAWVLVNTLSAMAGSNALPPDRPIDLFCHSLGSRVVIQALKQMAQHDRKLLRRVGRVILIGGAEYAEEARAMLEAVGDDGPECYNFMGRHDRILTHLAGKYHPVLPEARSRPIGYYGLESKAISPRWIDLALDGRFDFFGRWQHPLSDWLKGRDMPPVDGADEQPPSEWRTAGAPTLGLLYHWHYFMAPGNMVLFRTILRDRPAWEIARLRRENIPENEPGAEVTGGFGR